jgi:hypothetical protein
MMALMAWAYCLIGAVGLTVYLATVGAGALRARHLGVERTPSPPSRGAVGALVAFAISMAAMGIGLAALVLFDQPSAFGRAAAWAGLPWWSALTATLTAVVWSRRRRAKVS